MTMHHSDHGRSQSTMRNLTRPWSTMLHHSRFAFNTLCPINWPFLLDLGQSINGPRLTMVDFQRSINCAQLITVNWSALSYQNGLLSQFPGSTELANWKFGSRLFSWPVYSTPIKVLNPVQVVALFSIPHISIQYNVQKICLVLSTGLFLCKPQFLGPSFKNVYNLLIFLCWCISASRNVWFHLGQFFITGLEKTDVSYKSVVSQPKLKCKLGVYVEREGEGGRVSETPYRQFPPCNPGVEIFFLSFCVYSWGRYKRNGKSHSPEVFVW